eukprot:6425826-Lingulodinium_polyedra.AAC.1
MLPSTIVAGCPGPAARVAVGTGWAAAAGVGWAATATAAACCMTIAARRATASCSGGKLAARRACHTP